jgi:hypothetical protein
LFVRLFENILFFCACAEFLLLFLLNTIEIKLR